MKLEISMYSGRPNPVIPLPDSFSFNETEKAFSVNPHPSRLHIMGYRQMILVTDQNDRMYVNPNTKLEEQLKQIARSNGIRV